MRNFKLWKRSSFAALIILTLVSGGCSSQKASSILKAVEVGNPEDTPGKKPSQPVPMRLVQIEIETQSLDEIAAVELQIDTIKLEIEGRSTQQFLASSANAQKGTKLTLQPGSKNVLEFSVPLETLQSAASLKVAFKFNEQNPGQVVVGADRFQIEQQSEALRLPLATPSNTEKQSTQALQVKRELNKAELFEPVAPATRSTTNGPESTIGTAPNTSAGPSPTIYRLRK